MSRRRTISETMADKTNSIKMDETPPAIINSDSTVKLTVEYDPFEHRNVEFPNSYLESLINLTKVAIGTGILALPMAYHNSGMVFGTFLMLFLSFITTYCVHILISTSREVCKTLEVPVMGFGETVEKVFETGPPNIRKYSKFARSVVDTALVVSTFSTSVYIVFLAETLMDFLKHMFDIQGSERIFIVIVTIPVLFMAQIRQLKHIVPFSLCANCFLFTAFGITLYYVFGGTLSFSDKPLIVSCENWPFAISTIMYAITTIRNVVSIENEMKNPKKFLGPFGVLNVSSYIVTILYTVMGIFGYARFGSDVKGSITLNLPSDEILAIIAQILISIAILFSTSLMLYTAVEVIYQRWGHKLSKQHENISQILIRTGIVIILSVFAILIPNLKVFISIVGAIFLGTLGLLIPAVTELIHRYPNRYGFLNWKFWMNIFLIVFYFIVLTSGLFVDIIEIIKIYTN